LFHLSYLYISLAEDHYRPVGYIIVAVIKLHGRTKDEQAHSKDGRRARALASAWFE